MPNVTETFDGLTLSIRVIPRAKREKIIGKPNEAIKVYLTTPPEDGRANEALIELLAKTIKIKRSQVSVISGLKSRKKSVHIKGTSAELFFARLESRQQ